MGLDFIPMESGGSGVTGGSPPSMNMLHFHQRQQSSGLQSSSTSMLLGGNTNTENLFSDVSQLYTGSNILSVDGGAGVVSSGDMKTAALSGPSAYAASSSSSSPAAPPSMVAAPAVVPVPDSWEPHPLDPLRFVKYEIRQLLLSRGSLSIAQLPEEYLKYYRKPLTQALKMLDSQYTPESARSGKPSGRARKSTLGAFLREHLTDVVEVRQRPHGQHEIVAAGSPPSPPLSSSGAGAGASPSMLPSGAGMGMGGSHGGGKSGSQQQQQQAAAAAAVALTMQQLHIHQQHQQQWQQPHQQQQQWQQQQQQFQQQNHAPEHVIRALILQQPQQQQQQQQQHLAQLRSALSQVSSSNDSAVGGGVRGMTSPDMLLSPTYSGGLPAVPPLQHHHHHQLHNNQHHHHHHHQRGYHNNNNNGGGGGGLAQKFGGAASLSSELRLPAELTMTAREEALMNSQSTRDAPRSTQIKAQQGHGDGYGSLGKGGGGGGGILGSASSGDSSSGTFFVSPGGNHSHKAAGEGGYDKLSLNHLNLNSNSPVTVPAANMLAMSHPSAGPSAIAAAAVGALRGAALLNAAQHDTSDIPAENRIYVTWRVPSKATPLRVEDLWGHFSRFGQLAFCNPRPLRHSHAPRRTPSLSGAGYAFLGFAPPGGAEAVQRVLSRPSHAIRGAELRVKPWRDRDEGTGSGDAPAHIIAAAAAAADTPAAPVGDYYFPHPDSGLPVLASNLNLSDLSSNLRNLGKLGLSGAGGAAWGAGTEGGSGGVGGYSVVGAGSGSAYNTMAPDKGVEGDTFDEKALFGDNFFNVGNDDGAGGGVNVGVDSGAVHSMHSTASTSTWFGGGGGHSVWGGNDAGRKSLDAIRATLSETQQIPHNSAGAPKESGEQHSSQQQQQQQLTHRASLDSFKSLHLWQGEATGASTDTWSKSRLWNYTAQGN